MSAFDDLPPTATFDLKPKRLTGDEPVTKGRSSFISYATVQKGRFKAGVHGKKDWYRKEGDRWTVWVKNGTAVMPLPSGKTRTWLDTEEEVLQFFDIAIRACNQGEFDRHFVAVTRKKRSVVQKIIDSANDGTPIVDENDPDFKATGTE